MARRVLGAIDARVGAIIDRLDRAESAAAARHEDLRALLIQMHGDTWDNAQLRHRDLLADMATRHVDAWESADRRTVAVTSTMDQAVTNLKGLLIQLHEDAWVADDTRWRDLIALLSRVNEDNWRAADRRHRDAMQEAATQHHQLHSTDELVAAGHHASQEALVYVGRWMERLEGAVDDLRAAVADLNEANDDNRLVNVPE